MKVVRGRLICLSIVLCTLWLMPSSAFSSPQAIQSPPSRSIQSSEPPPIQFRWPEEEFYYSVRINGIEAMRAAVRVGNVRTANNRPYVPISGTAQSMGIFQSIYPLDDRANTFFDPRSLYPLRSEKSFNENHQERAFYVDYQHRHHVANVRRVQPKSTREFVSPIPSQTHDMLTWMYELRTQESMYIGKTMSFYIYDGWLLSQLNLEVVGREDIHTPMGWFKAWRIDFSREILELKPSRKRKSDHISKEPEWKVRESGKHSGSLWVSRDENHLPIRFTINTPLGIGEAVLIKYQPAKRVPRQARTHRSRATSASLCER